MEQQEDQSSVGPPSPKSLQNFKRARAHGFYFRDYFIEYKTWTYGFRLWPTIDNREEEFWRQGRVWWWRCWWLTFGLSITKSLPERRKPETPYRDIPGMKEFERRLK